MASSINASTTAGVVTTADTSGVLNIQTAGTTAISIDASQAVTMAGRTSNPTTISVGAATPSTSGAGITFPATQSASSNANTLDDYEEGTWTPVIRGSSTAGTYQQTVTRALYTKVGRQVTLQCYITMASTVTGGGTGYLQITGAPFTAFSPNQFPNTVLATDMAKSVTTLYVTATWANTTIISFQENQPTTLLDFPIANAVANKTLLFTMTYFTD